MNAQNLVDKDDSDEYLESNELKKIIVKNYKDILKCDICGGKYTRSNKSTHNKTKYHKKCNTMLNKVKKIIHGVF